MACTKRCAPLLLVSFLILVSCIVLAVPTADAQAYLYNYSYFNAGNSPLGAVLADFNRDGRSDLAVVNYDNTVSVMLGGANATFGPPVGYPTGASPFMLIAADLRGNGQTDLVTINTPNGIDQPGVVSILLGNGDGTFQAHVDYSVGDFPTGVVAGDFNGDGKIDLAIANESDDTISILYGNGDGTFQPQAAIAVGSEPTSIGSGDFNGDGKTDLIASCVGSGVVSVLLNTGGGTFTRVDTSSGLFSPDRSFVVTGNFTTGGNLDAVISSETQGQLYLLKGEGNGGFMSPKAVLKAPAEIYSLVAVDINRDGKIDLAYGSIAPDAFSVLFGTGSGTFSTPVASPVFATESIALADINGDGFLDLVTPQENLNSVAVVLGNGKGQFGSPKTENLSGTGYSPNSTVVADFNGDGKLDLAIAETNFPAGQVAVSLGNGEGSFGTPIISPLLSEAINNSDLMFTGDFNGDGKPDLIFMDDYSTGFQVLLGNGDGTFQTPVDTKLNTSLNFAIGDFNGDGKTDAVVSTISNSQNLISIYLSDGDGTFTLGAQYTEQYGGPYVADVNGDGKQDLIFIGNPVFVMLGNGDGTFQKPIAGPVLTSSAGGVIADFTGDGKVDIAVGTYDGVAFLKGNGNGTFQNPVYSNSSIGFCCRMLAADVNGDGRLDLVNNESGAFVMLGNGDGTFQSPFSYNANGVIYSGNVVTGDFNSDGVSDVGLIFQSFATGTTDLSLYLSASTIDIFPAAIDFGSENVGQTGTAVSVQVANVGNRTLSTPVITVTGNFIERNDCDKKLAIGKGCTIGVQFRPQASGTQTGVITIKDSAMGGSQQVSLTGVGK